MTFALPGVLDTDTLPRVVLQAAALDGELYRIGDAYRVVDLPPDTHARAMSLRSLSVSGHVIAGRTAAWVWGVLAERPEPLETILPSDAAGAHCGALVLPGVRTRGCRLRREEIVSLLGVEVTSIRRTAIDLLCAREPRVDDAELLALIQWTDPGLDTLGSDLSGRRRLRGRRRGLARLQLLVTR